MRILISALPLNLNIIEILIHMFNLAVLIVAVRFLLYKPIKKFMEKRAAEYRTADEETRKKLQEAEEFNENSKKLLDEARREAVSIADSTSASAREQADEIVTEAKEKAEGILERAYEDIRLKTEEETRGLKHAISELAVTLASEILEKEVTAEDNDKAIDDILNKWEHRS
ncbi:MAG: F0F1 ATP synthase subunit B [Clostridiaceae bacterium]|jgi:F-type H+-transporting ATPase subunit b|nr:F0F1 ATP synthase subunit B [Clostridiaceae bacterium]